MIAGIYFLGAFTSEALYLQFRTSNQRVRNNYISLCWPIIEKKTTEMRNDEETKIQKKKLVNNFKHRFKDNIFDKQVKMQHNY